MCTRKSLPEVPYPECADRWSRIRHWLACRWHSQLWCGSAGRPRAIPSGAAGIGFSRNCRPASRKLSNRPNRARGCKRQPVYDARLDDRQRINKCSCSRREPHKRMESDFFRADGGTSSGNSRLSIPTPAGHKCATKLSGGPRRSTFNWNGKESGCLFSRVG